MKPENIKILKEGGVGVMPTDTVYGVICSAFPREALDRLFRVKGRDENKPPIILVADIPDLEKFGIHISSTQAEFMGKYWPGKVTIIFAVPENFSYLDKGLGLAIRLPADEGLREILRQTGPLATTSANFQGQAVAKNITEAKKYFGNNVDFYEDGGELESLPSTLVKITGDKMEILRQGVAVIS